MKINPAPFHVAQAVITGVVVILSVAILGTSAHALHVFNRQHLSNPWWVPMWPQHFDVQGTKALIASSVVTLVLCGAFLIASFIPKLALREKYTLRALLSLGALLPTLLLTLITTIWAKILNGNAPEVDTIQTWTCKMQSSRPLEQNLPEGIAMPAGMGNGDFKSLCQSSKFALWGTFLVFLLVGASVGITIVAWVADKWAARQRRKEFEMGNIPANLP